MDGTGANRGLWALVRRQKTSFLWLLLVLASVPTWSACTLVNDTGQRLRDYEASIRAEADWLWNNMNFARTHLEPSMTYCQSEIFTHRGVELTDAARQNDPRTADLVDRLDYAAVLVRQAHDEWDRFCDYESSAATTTASLERRLTLAYDSMNQVRVALVPTGPTPRPGST